MSDHLPDYSSPSADANPTTVHEALGQSDRFLDFQERLSQAAQINRPVLLIGERGTGKELAASRIHWGGRPLGRRKRTAPRRSRTERRSL